MGSYSTYAAGLSPVAYWRMKETSGNAADSSGNSRTLTANGTLTYSQQGWAADGATIGFGSGYFSRADEAAWDMGTGDFALAWTFRRLGLPTGSEALISHSDAGDGGEWHVRIWQDVAFDIYLDGSNHRLWHSGSELCSGALQHCVLNFDRDANAIFYLNGSSYGSVSIAGKSAAALDNVGTLWVGSQSSGSMAFNGRMGELMIVKGGLIDAAALYAERLEQLVKPDADTATTGWTTTPLWSKVDEDPGSPDATVISATSS